MSLRHCAVYVVSVRQCSLSVVRVRQSALSVVRVREGKEQDRMVAKGCEGDWEWKTEKVNILVNSQSKFSPPLCHIYDIQIPSCQGVSSKEILCLTKSKAQREA